MLRKRSRSHQKDQATMADSGSDNYSKSDALRHNNHKSNSFFSVPGLFIGMTSKGSLDSDAVRSPKSPLDFRVFSNLGTPSIRSPRSSSLHTGQQRSWDCSKVGLSIVDSLNDDKETIGKKCFRPSESRNILFAPGMRTNSHSPKYEFQSDVFHAPKSLPKDYVVPPHNTHFKSPLQKGSTNVVFEIGENPSELEPFGKIWSCSLDSCKTFSGLSGRKASSRFGNTCLENNALRVGSPLELTKPTQVSVSIGSGNGFIESLSADEIELSEDYTCVISHGPNPKTTHIYGDCILECHENELSNGSLNKTEKHQFIPAISMYTSADNFLKFCYFCNKKLDGEDIYIYRGEKAFCSLDCRSHEILIDEEMEKNDDQSSPTPDSDNGHKLFENGIIVEP